MTVYEASSVRDLISNHYSLSNPKKYIPSITNNFEGNTLLPWVGTGVLETDETHTGAYAVDITDKYISAIIYGGITKALLSAFEFWVYSNDESGQDNITVTLTFSDGTTSSASKDVSYQTWSKIDILTWIINPCSPSYLFPSDKLLTQVEISNTDGVKVYIDDIAFTQVEEGTLIMVLDEYDPNNPQNELVFITRPENIIHIAPNVIKHEQSVIIEYYTKLVNYNPDDIYDTIRPNLLTVKEELTRILNTYRYDSIADGVTINHSAWRDAKFPHGYGGDLEPISFLTTMEVQLHYYEAIDGTEVGTRVSEVKILGSDLLGVTDVDWGDTDPWVKLQVPKGPLLEQHLLGPHIDGKIVCHDWNSIYTQLYTIPISAGGNTYPVNSDNSKTKFSTTSVQFSIFMEDASGNIAQFDFNTVRIKRIILDRGSTSGTFPTSWIIEWMAETVTIGGV